MTTFLIILCVLLWLACPILCFGMSIAYFWSESPTLQSTPDRMSLLKTECAQFAFCGFLAGPIALLLIFLLSGFAKHGLRFR